MTVTVTVREAEPESTADTEAFARIRHRALPRVVSTGASIAYAVRQTPPDAHYQPLPAVADGPMLAINKWFGHEICATEVQHVREPV